MIKSWVVEIIWLKETLMTEDFLDLVVQARNGEPNAVNQLIKEYGEVIRREVRFMSLDRRIQRVVSDSDIVQSVLARFFFDLIAGRVEFRGTEQMAEFVKVVTRTEVKEVARFWTAKQRDVRRTSALRDGEALEPNVQYQSPSSRIVTAELVQAALGELSQRELMILKRRQEGCPWKDIAAQLGEGESPEAIRKQHGRALSRVARRLEIPEG